MLAHYVTETQIMGLRIILLKAGRPTMYSKEEAHPSSKISTCARKDRLVFILMAQELIFSVDALMF